MSTGVSRDLSRISSPKKCAVRPRDTQYSRGARAGVCAEVRSSHACTRVSHATRSSPSSRLPNLYTREYTHTWVIYIYIYNIYMYLYIYTQALYSSLRISSNAFADIIAYYYVNCSSLIPRYTQLDSLAKSYGRVISLLSPANSSKRVD